jgi:hypothetical protein
MPESILEVPVLAAIVAVVVVLGKIIEVLLIKSMPKKSVLTDEERDWMKSLYEILDKCDTDGTPLAYVPRSWAEIQKDMQGVMTQIVGDQRRIADILERIDKKLDD